jgi:CheY-like chemotaxis protein
MKGLDGRRILVVEDESLVAMLIEDLLQEAGCVVVGPVGRVAKAVVMAQAEVIDAALLDLNLAGESVIPIIEALTRRNVPFVFVTGYGHGHLPAGYTDRPVLRKPFRQEDLVKELLGVIA